MSNHRLIMVFAAALAMSGVAAMGQQNGGAPGGGMQQGNGAPSNGSMGNGMQNQNGAQGQNGAMNNGSMNHGNQGQNGNMGDGNMRTRPQDSMGHHHRRNRKSKHHHHPRTKGSGGMGNGANRPNSGSNPDGGSTSNPH